MTTMTKKTDVALKANNGTISRMSIAESSLMSANGDVGDAVQFVK
jgi:hypothetical protein